MRDHTTDGNLTVVRIPRRGEASPWGAINSVQEMDDGVFWIDTPRHGGLWLHPRRRASLPDGYVSFVDLHRPGQFDRGAWHEEDCDAPMVCVALGVKTHNPIEAIAAGCEQMAKGYRGQTRRNWKACKRAASVRAA